MTGTLLECRNFEEGNYDTLITKTTQYAAKLLKKPDQVLVCQHFVCTARVRDLLLVNVVVCCLQCRMVTMCAHLFWAGKEDNEKKYHDGRRVLECLQRSLKIADVCMTSSMHVHLFVEILNQYLYYFDNNNPSITSNYISGLIALINEHINNMDESDARTAVELHYQNTLKYIEQKKQNAEFKEKYADIAV